LKAIQEDRVVDSVKGQSAEVKKDKNWGFMSIGGMIDVIKGAEESCFSRMIAAVS
jgi:hypothetical protein